MLSLTRTFSRDASEVSPAQVSKESKKNEPVEEAIFACQGNRSLRGFIRIRCGIGRADRIDRICRVDRFDHFFDLHHFYHFPLTSYFESEGASSEFCGDCFREALLSEAEDRGIITQKQSETFLRKSCLKNFKGLKS